MYEEKEEKRQEYLPAFKLKVLRDYYEQGQTMYACAKKWELKNQNLILSWKKLYPISSKELSLPEEVIESYMKKEKSKDRIPTREEALESRVKALEKALQMEKLRSRAYEIMIDIAEREEGIQIRKKSGAKQ